MVGFNHSLYGNDHRDMCVPAMSINVSSVAKAPKTVQTVGLDRFMIEEKPNEISLTNLFRLYWQKAFCYK